MGHNSSCRVLRFLLVFLAIFDVAHCYAFYTETLPTSTPTSEAVVSDLCWTPYINTDDGSDGNYKRLRNVNYVSSLCSSPRASECKPAYGQHTLTGINPTVSPQDGYLWWCSRHGLSCISQRCHEYNNFKVRFLCPCHKCWHKMRLDADLGRKQVISFQMEESSDCLWEIHAPPGMTIRLKFLSDQNVTAALKLWDLNLAPDDSILGSHVRWWNASFPYYVSQTSVVALQIPVYTDNTSVSALEFECELYPKARAFLPCNFDEDGCGWNMSNTVWQRLACYSGTGDYRGNLSATVTGQVCQRWRSNYPHEPTFNISQYPELVGHRYCRNPGGIRAQPWCFTINRTVNKDYCPVIPCSSCNTTEMNRCVFESQNSGMGYVLSPHRFVDRVHSYHITSPVYRGLHSHCLAFGYRTTVQSRLPQKALTTMIVSLDHYGTVVERVFYNTIRRNEWYDALMEVPDNTDFYIQLVTHPTQQWHTGQLAVDNFYLIKCPKYSEMDQCWTMNSSQCPVSFMGPGNWIDKNFLKVITSPQLQLSPGYSLRGCRLLTLLSESSFVSLEYNDGFSYAWPSDRGYRGIRSYCSRVAYTLGYQVFAVGSDGRCYGSASIQTAFATTTAAPCPVEEDMQRSVYKPYYWPDGYLKSTFMVYAIWNNSMITNYRILKRQTVYYKSFMWNGGFSKSPSTPPYIAFTLQRRGDTAERCVSFDYEAYHYLPYVEVTIIDSRSKKQTGERSVVWKAPVWKARGWTSAGFALSMDTEVVATRIRIVLSGNLWSRGYVSIANLTVIRCSRDPSCTFDKSNCGWHQVPSSCDPTTWQLSADAPSFYQQRRAYFPLNATFESTYGYLTRYWYADYYSRHCNRQLFSRIRSPPIPNQGYRCFTFHYSIETGREHLLWSYVVRSLINGLSRTELSLQPAMGSSQNETQWGFGALSLPPDFEGFLEIEFAMCRNCRLALDDFVFTQSTCQTISRGCSPSQHNCSQLCVIGVNGPFCACSPRYYLAPDEHTCLPKCTQECKNNGICVAPDVCRCAPGFIYVDCRIACGSPLLTDRSGTIRAPSERNHKGILLPYTFSCHWEIRAPVESGSFLQLTVQSNRNYKYCYSNNTGLTIHSDNASEGLDLELITEKPFNISVFSGKLAITYTKRRYPDECYRLGIDIDYKVIETKCLDNCYSSLTPDKRCCSGYVVMLPSVLRQGSLVSIDLVLRGIETPLSLNASLWNSLGDLQFTTTDTSRPKVSGNTDIQYFNIEVPEKLDEGVYELSVIGMAGSKQIINGLARVSVAAKGPTVLVQTDKPVYRAGQTVRVRIVVIDFNMKPSNQKVTVEIMDGGGKKVYKWTDLQPINGLVNRSFPLSSEPEIGTWNITVLSHFPPKNKTFIVQSASFHVKDYVLPKFEVRLFVPSFVVYGDEQLTGAAAARYTRGHPVKGNLCLYVTSKFVNMYSHLQQTKPLEVCQPIDGIASFSLPLSMVVNHFFVVYGIGPESLELNATVTEKGTIVSYNTSEILAVAMEPYFISFVPGTRSFFKPGLPFFAKMWVTTPDNLPALNVTGLTLEISGDNELLYYVTLPVVNGSAAHEVYYNRNKYESLMSLRATVSGTRGINSIVSMAHDLQLFQSPANQYISVEAEKPIMGARTHPVFTLFSTREVKDTLHVMTISKEKIWNFWNIPISTFPSQQDKGLYQFSFDFFVDCFLAPAFHLVSYYITRDGLAVEDIVDFVVETCFEHEVELSFVEKEVRPGQTVEVSVKALPDATVSLSAVDKSVLLLPTYFGSQMTRKRVEYEISQYFILEDQNGSLSDPRHWWKGWWKSVDVPHVFKESGMNVISNYFFSRGNSRRVKRQTFDDTKTGDTQSFLSVTRSLTVRSLFPEVWLWEDIKTDGNGEWHANITVPHSITTWIADAFALSSNASLGMVESHSSLLAFKPFFVSLTLPVSLIRGEEIAIITTVFNYFYKELKVVVSIDNSSIAFDIVEGFNPRTTLTIPAKDALTTKFPIIPRSLGYIPIKVTAVSTVESDSVLRMLLVESEGIPQQYYKSIQMVGHSTDALILDLLPSTINDSAKGILSVSGSILGPAINSLGSLLHMPSGCCEQNMIRFAPAVLIKRYLKRTNQLTPEIDKKATLYMEKGYQRQLGYQLSDGGYALHTTHKASSTCLTAFVLHVYALAMDVMYIDQASMLRSVCWLIAQQRYDGAFYEPGRCFHLKLECGKSVDRTTILTAYSLIALVEVSKRLPSSKASCLSKLSRTIRRSRSYLENLRSYNGDSSYVQCMRAYALALAESPMAFVLAEELLKTVTASGEACYWTCDSELCRNRSTCSTSAGTVETTAYSLLTFQHLNRLPDSHCIARWLVSQMDAWGGYRSTQDTVLALMALTQYAVGTVGSVHLEISMPFSDSQVVEVSSVDATQTVEFAVPAELHLKNSGDGAALIQATVKYNVPKLAPDESFELSVTALPQSNANTRNRWADNHITTEPFSVWDDFVTPTHPLPSSDSNLPTSSTPTTFTTEPSYWWDDFATPTHPSSSSDSDLPTSSTPTTFTTESSYWWDDFATPTHPSPSSESDLPTSSTPTTFTTEPFNWWDAFATPTHPSPSSDSDLPTSSTTDRQADITTDPFYSWDFTTQPSSSTDLPTQAQLDDTAVDVGTFHLEVCVRWRPVYEVSRTAIVEVQLPSGYATERYIMKKLSEFNNVGLRRFEIEGKQAIFYFDGFESNTTCFKVFLIRTHCVVGIQPSYAKVYLYYEPDVSTTVTYHLPSTLFDSFDKCDGRGRDSARPRPRPHPSPRPLRPGRG